VAPPTQRLTVFTEPPSWRITGGDELILETLRYAETDQHSDREASW